MPRITVKVGGREPLRASVLKGTPLGALGTEGVVHVGALELSGRAPGLRALADALVEAADLAEQYDADPDGYDDREREATEGAAP